MKYIQLFDKTASVSQVALGCMRIGDMTDAQADAYLAGAVDCGYNYFDHADIYGGGRCEEIFGGALKRQPHLRDKIFIQTKCSIRKGWYDFSKAHILSSVEQSLKRLGVEKIDVLLLHRPDILMEPEEVAAAFDSLYQSGKVAAFGVSNHHPLQIELLQKSIKQKLCVNQLQLSLARAKMLSASANVNVDNSHGGSLDGYVRDYCRLHGITIQPWSPLQHATIAGSFIGSEDYAPLNAKLTELADKYGVSETGLAVAWLLRLPDKMQPIVGSTNLQRLQQIAAAAEIELSAEDWYALYRAAGYPLP